MKYKLFIEKDENIDLKKVLDFATKKHFGQTRDNGSPYIIHPVRVAKLVKKYKKSKHPNILMSAALLHDTLEDTYTSIKELYDLLGKDSIVPSMVVELTTAKFMPKLVGKAEYLAYKMEDMSSYALAIKLCDRLDNISDLSGCSNEKRQKMLSDTHFMIDYIDEHRELTNTHKKIIADIKKILKKYGY